MTNLNYLPLAGVLGDNGILSNNHASDTPSRKLLAFFVSKFWFASPAIQSKDTTLLPLFLGVIRHILDRLKLERISSYDWKTSQNSPFWVICGAVACVTESDSSHPFYLSSKSVLPTQNNTQGGQHNA